MCNHRVLTRERSGGYGSIKLPAQALVSFQEWLPNSPASGLQARSRGVAMRDK